MAKILDSIRSPEDLRRLPAKDLPVLAAEIREEILQTVSRTGGHLASSLGTVELAIALHRVFQTPEDGLVWDVGHQSYAHKILTGRRELFRELRQYGGCAPFQSRLESPEFDPIGGGHAGTAISAALGLETAAKRTGKCARYAAIVGDGSLGCGVSLEGLNNIDENRSSLVIVLNDNRMSISGNVGGLTHYLNRIISGHSYTRFRGAVKNALKGNDSVTVKGGNVEILKCLDGIKSDSLDAGKGYVRIEGGTVSISGDDDGLQASQALEVVGGTVTISVGDKPYTGDGTIDVAEGCVVLK